MTTLMTFTVQVDMPDGTDPIAAEGWVAFAVAFYFGQLPVPLPGNAAVAIVSQQVGVSLAAPAITIAVAPPLTL